MRSKVTFIPITAIVAMTSAVASADNSTDYVGPCAGETVAAAPIHLAANVNHQWDITTITLTQTGRLRIGVDGPVAYYDIYLLGPSSYVCDGYLFPNGCEGAPSGQPIGLCTIQQGLNATTGDIVTMGTYGQQPNVCYPGYTPGQLRFAYQNRFDTVSFTWYESPSVPPGTYAVRVNAGGGNSEGHGTMDVYAFYGNGGVHQPVSCPVPQTPTGSLTASNVTACDANGLGQATINWTANNTSSTQIRVNSATGTVFAGGGAKGSATTGEWLSSAGTTFYLESVFNGVNTVLAVLDVGCVTPKGTLFASNVTTCNSSGVGQATINWTSTNTSSTQIRVGSPTGTLFSQGGANGSAPTGLWLSASGVMFYLENIVNGVSTVLTTLNVACTH